MWSKARLTTYLTGFVGLVGLALAGLGLAEFDYATGQIDIGPFNAYALVAGLPALVATVLAPAAMLMGWKPK